jgi:hypothetical protein
VLTLLEKENNMSRFLNHLKETLGIRVDTEKIDPVIYAFCGGIFFVDAMDVIYRHPVDNILGAMIASLLLGAAYYKVHNLK